MLYTVKHVGLDGGVVVHVLKCDAVTAFERLFKAPVTHVITTQARIAAHAVSGLHRIHLVEGLADFRLIGHLQAIGHVAGK